MKIRDEQFQVAKRVYLKTCSLHAKPWFDDHALRCALESLVISEHDLAQTLNENRDKYWAEREAKP